MIENGVVMGIQIYAKTPDGSPPPP